MTVVFQYKDKISIKNNPNKYNECSASNVSSINEAIKIFGFNNDDTVVDWKIKEVIK